MKVFNNEVNEFCQKFLVLGNPVSPADTSNFSIRHREIEASIFEQLLLFDNVTFKVYGENVPLALLLNRLGVEGVEQLAEERAIGFLLWTPMVTYMVDDIPGLNPIQPGILTSKPHCDPEESITLGLEWMAKKPNKWTRRSIIRKLRDLYIVPDRTFADQAANNVLSAYHSGKLETFGFDQNADVTKLKRDERKKLCECAGEVLEYACLGHYQLGSYGNSTYSKLFENTVKNLASAKIIAGNFCHISRLEGIPDLNSIFKEANLSLKTVPGIRKKTSSIKFRKWLESLPETQNSEDLYREYLNAIVSAKGFLQTVTGKLTKTVVLSSIGAAIGGSIAGIGGAAFGVSLSKIIEPAADIGIDLIDEFFLDGLAKGWSPRIFFDDIKEAAFNQKGTAAKPQTL